MNNQNKLIIWLPLIGTVLITAGMWVGYLLSPRIDLSTAERKMLEVMSLIRDEYVDEVSADSLVELTIPYMLDNLDPHSAYISAKDLERVNSELEGSFGGIGIKFQMPSDTVCVVEVIAGSPAETAGLRPGDRIVTVDGENIAGQKLSTEDIFNKLRGKAGTSVNVGIKRRDHKELLNFDLVRDMIPQPSIDSYYMTADTMAYVKVSRFARDTYPAFYQAVTALYLDGAKGLIVDLRGNTGGFLDQAVLMANEFLPAEAVIVETRGRNIDENSIIKADGTGLFQELDMVVLIDESSASASEIFAGSIQDNDRGLIIGRRSFGKALVQKPIMLADSSEIRLTVQRYYTPSGRSIQKDYSGDRSDYEEEIFQRYLSGEVFDENAGTEPRNPELVFKTLGGRSVYGGGGISPDIFVPSDTTNRSSYYVNAVNQGLLQAYAYEYVDLNRDEMSKYKTVNELLEMLDSDAVLLNSFVNYAAQRGLARRWFYINHSAPLIINQIKALVAQDVLGLSGYFEVRNTQDPDVLKASEMLLNGKAHMPVTSIEPAAATKSAKK